MKATDKKFHYVYRITNIVTEMYYYGDRSCDCHPSEDIGIKYFSTSSLKLFIQDQQNNPQDYKYKVIKIFETCRDDAKQLEVDLHKKFDVKNHPKFINRANQTSKGFSTFGVKYSDAQKLHLSILNSGKNNGFYGKKHSVETIKRMSISSMNNVIVQDKKGNRFSVDKSDERIILGELITINKLNSQSADYRKKLSENHADVSGENNPRAKKVEIYDSENNLMYECCGNMRIICKDNKLPYNQLKVTKSKPYKMAFENMSPQTKSKHIKNGFYPKFKGWYAQIID